MAGPPQSAARVRNDDVAGVAAAIASTASSGSVRSSSASVTSSSVKRLSGCDGGLCASSSTGVNAVSWAGCLAVGSACSCGVPCASTASASRRPPSRQTPAAPEAMNATTYFHVLHHGAHLFALKANVIPDVRLDLEAIADGDSDGDSDSWDGLGDDVGGSPSSQLSLGRSQEGGSDESPCSRRPSERHECSTRRRTMSRLSDRIVDRVAGDLQTVMYNQEYDYGPYELMLRQDLAANKLRWHGVWSSDLWCFLRNNNPVLSLCFSHPLHPISRKNRWVAMFLQLLFLLFLSSVITEARMCAACGVDGCDGLDSGCVLEPVLNRSDLSNGTAVGEDGVRHLQVFPSFGKASWREQKRRNMRFTPQLNFCCTARKVFAIWFFERFGILGGVLYGVLANCIFALTVFPLMMCACVQACPPRVRVLGEWSGYGLVAAMAAVLVSFTPFVARYCIANHMFGELMVNITVGKFGGWACVTLINVVAFTSGWSFQGGAVNGAASEQKPSPVATSQQVVEEDLRSSSKASPTSSGDEDPESRQQAHRYHVSAEEYAEWARFVQREQERRRLPDEIRLRASTSGL